MDVGRGTDRPEEGVVMLALDYAAKWIQAVEVLSEVFRVEATTVERLLQSMTDEERDVLVQECGRTGPALSHHP
jgi:hypothetical protein